MGKGKATDRGKIIVGVDGSELSVEALRQAQRLAVALGSNVEACACWEFPAGREAYEMMGDEGFGHKAGEMLDDALTQAFGPERPRNVRARLVHGAPRPSLIDGSKHAAMLVLGRRGHGGFGGLLLGSVTSVCVAHAHCPVLVVHPPEPGGDHRPRPAATAREQTTHHGSMT